MDPTALQRQLAREALTKLAARRGLPTVPVGPPPQQVAPQQPLAPGAVTKSRIIGELGTHLNDLWNQSNPHTTNIPTSSRLLPGANPQSKKQEQGCWIIHNTGTDTLRAEDFAPGERDGLDPQDPQLGPGEQVRAWFHTHPNTGDEGYDKGPSSADVNWAGARNCPGVVRAQIGGYVWFGPPLPD